MNIDIAKLGYRWKGIYSAFLTYVDNDIVYMNGGAYVIKNGLPVAFGLGQRMATGAGQVLTGNVAVSGIPDTALHSNGADSMEFRFMGGRNGVIATKLMSTDRMECSGNNLSNNYMSAIMSDGSVRIWGLKANGQSGTGLYSTEDFSLPSRVAFPPGTPSIKQVVSNWNDTYFLDANGTVWHSGANRSDYMSGRNTVGATGIPTKINGFGDLGVNTVITKIFQSNGYGSSPSMFLLDNLGRVYCWGYNGYGNLGNGTITNILVPYLIPFTVTTPIKDIYATGAYAATFLITTTGIMYTAGETNTSLYTATNREFRPVMPWGFNKTVKQVFGSETYYSGGDPPGAIASRRYGVVLDNGEMWCWGDASGSFADGFGISYTTGVFQGNAIYPIKVLDGVSFAQANAGWQTMMALMTDGTVKWTGYNGQGIGGANAGRQTWITIGDGFLTGVTKLRMYGYASYSTAVALLNDGRVIVWGYGANGQVGDGYNTTTNYPNKYLLIDKTVVDFEAGAQFGAGSGALYCLTSDGQVMMNGIGTNSASGDPAATSRFAPSPIIF
jgi:alpha-tubulin suppressor-like RCC1 family protein